MVHYIAEVFSAGLRRIQADDPDWFVGIRQNGVVIGLVQLQLPNVVTPDDLAAQTKVIVEMVAKARRNLGTMELVVFPEYALHGLSMDINPAIMCRIDGPGAAACCQPSCAGTELQSASAVLAARSLALVIASSLERREAGGGR